MACPVVNHDYRTTTWYWITTIAAKVYSIVRHLILQEIVCTTVDLILVVFISGCLNATIGCRQPYSVYACSRSISLTLMCRATSVRPNCYPYLIGNLSFRQHIIVTRVGRLPIHESFLQYFCSVVLIHSEPARKFNWAMLYSGLSNGSIRWIICYWVITNQFPKAIYLCFDRRPLCL